MSIMTAEQYNERKTSLVLAISHAEGEFQSASFKELTGKGSVGTSVSAKQHLELLREELEKVEAAWIASKAEIDRLNREKAVENFESLAADIDKLLTSRKKDLRDLIKAVESAAQSLARYQDNNAQIRLKSMALVQSGTVNAIGAHAQVLRALEINVASTAFAAILNTANVVLTNNSLLRDAFPNGDAMAVEEKLAASVRTAVRSSAPIEEAA